MANFKPKPQSDSEIGQTIERLPSMQRGVSQLLFNYLPYRTVDWEDGLAIVQLANIRFSTVWEEERKTTLLKEIDQHFDRWRARGGTVDTVFPLPLREPERYTVGAPDSIDATVLQAALICQRCGQLIFDKKLQKGDSLRCPHCESPRVHQFPFVFVHGCGELYTVQEWMPATKKNADSGALDETHHPIRCEQCKKSTDLYVPGRSDRVKDMKVLCRKCNAKVLDRFTARCHRCLKQLRRTAPARSLTKVLVLLSPSLPCAWHDIAPAIHTTLRRCRFSGSTGPVSTVPMIRYPLRFTEYFRNPAGQTRMFRLPTP